MADGGQTNLEKLQAGQFWCRSCGAAHRGMFDLASIAPRTGPAAANMRTRAQRNGITVDHLLSIYRANGHDIA